MAGLHIAALITAAGMSSRMGEFKPLLGIGNSSISQRIIAVFHKAGIRDIVIVTGYRAEDLERHLSGEGIIFLRNDSYETTEMFDSVCTGLRFLEGKYSRILFTPVDIPLFTAETVHTLTACNAPLAIPVCGGRAGHPVLIADHLIRPILEDSGSGGLKGALSRCGTPVSRIPVDDPGILHDADTPDDYRQLLAYHTHRISD